MKMHDHNIHSLNKNQEGNVHCAKGHNRIRRTLPAEAPGASKGTCQDPQCFGELSDCHY